MRHKIAVWAPQSSYTVESLLCNRCYGTINASETFIIDDYHILNSKMDWKGSALCSKCGISEMIKENSEAIREIVREELEVIFKKEIADPNGRYGPGKV